MAAFGARSIPTSVSRMEKEPVPQLRQSKQRFSYAESEDSNDTPKSSPGNSSFGGSPEMSENTVIDLVSEDELQSDDVIHVAPRADSTRDLPERTTRSKVNYATPKRPLKKKTISKGNKGQRPLKLTSDLFATSKSTKSHPQTARGRTRQDIADSTKPKRCAFLLANKEYFLPLLPETSYIDKLQRLRDMGDPVTEPESVPYEVIEAQPKDVRAIMKPYQLEGLSFLVHMYRNGISAILGDEMGLGKTLQTLSLFQYLENNEPTRGEKRPYLVVCPLSVLSSWINEAKRWVPGLHVARFHGPKAERERLKLDCRKSAAKIDVVVTTYETFVAEQGWFKRAFVWRYCVLDEVSALSVLRLETPSPPQTSMIRTNTRTRATKSRTASLMCLARFKDCRQNIVCFLLALHFRITS